MLKEILKECIAEMMEDPMYLYTLESDKHCDIISYRLQSLGKGKLYVCEFDSINNFIYVNETRVSKKIEENRNKRIEEILEKI